MRSYICTYTGTYLLIGAFPSYICSIVVLVLTLIYRIIVQQNFIVFSEFSNLHGLIPSYTFIRFWKNYLPTRLFNHRLLLWNLHVGRLFFHPTRSYSILHVYCFLQKSLFHPARLFGRSEYCNI